MGDHKYDEYGLQTPHLKIRQIAPNLLWRGTKSQVDVAVSAADLCAVLENRVTSPEDALRHILLATYRDSGNHDLKPEQMMDGTWRQPIEANAAHRDLKALVDEAIINGSAHEANGGIFVNIIWLHFDRESLDAVRRVTRAQPMPMPPWGPSIVTALELAQNAVRLGHAPAPSKAEPSDVFASIQRRMGMPKEECSGYYTQATRARIQSFGLPVPDPPAPPPEQPAPVEAAPSMVDDATMRVVANRLIESLGGPMAAAVVRAAGLPDGASSAILGLLESSAGKAILALALSGSVGCLPVIPPHVQAALRRELQVRGLELVGNDIASALVSPLQSVLSTQGIVIREEKDDPKAPALLPQGPAHPCAPKVEDAPVRRHRAPVRR